MNNALQLKDFIPVDLGVMSRQRRRHELRIDEYKRVREEFDLPRRVSRAIARARVNAKREAA